MPSEKGETRYDYSKVMAIFLSCVFGYVIIITFIGPERRNFDTVKQMTEDHQEDDNTKKSVEYEEFEMLRNL